MADKSIFEQDFDSLLNSVGVQIDNKTETTNAPNEDVEPEQVKEAADKVETVAQKEAKKEKTTEDYRVDLDVLGGVAEDETDKPVAQDKTPKEQPKQDKTPVEQPETKANATDDVWGDPIGALSDGSTTNPFNNLKTVDNTKSTKSSVWGGPADTTKQQPKSDKSNTSGVWGGPKSDNDANAKVWGKPSAGTAAKTQSTSNTSSVWDEPKSDDKVNAQSDTNTASKAVASNKSETTKASAKDSKPDVSATDTTPKNTGSKAKKPSAAKAKKSASKQTEKQTSLDLSIELPEAIVALLGDEKDTIFSDIEAKAKAFILQEVKSAAKNAVDKQFIN